MKKLLIFTMLALFALSMSAFASQTRTLTIGDNNRVVLDEDNIWMFPSRINDYPSLAIGEFQDAGDDDFQQFGVHWRFDRDNPWVLGTYFDNMSPFEPDLSIFEDAAFDNGTLLDNRRIHLFYGRGLGAVNFGLKFSLYNSSQSTDAPADQSTEGLSYYDFTFGLTEGSGQWDVALNLGLGTWTDENEDGIAETEADGFMDFSVMGRYFYQVNPSYTLVPHAEFMYSKRGLKEFNADSDVADEDYALDNSDWMFDAGVGLNYTPATNVFAVMDFGFAYGKQKNDSTETGSPTQENTFTEFWLPYFKLGLDADVFRWLDVRMGATSYWTRTKDEDAASIAAKQNFADNETYLGFGFHFGRLHIDTYTDPQLFLDGFNFISGGDISNEMNFQLSAVYEMM